MSFQKSLAKALVTHDSLRDVIYNQKALNILPLPVSHAEGLVHINAYGSICVNRPYHYELSTLDSFCMFYTQEGEGILSFNNQCLNLKPGTLAFIDCSQQHGVEIKKSPWTYKVLFISGALVGHFYDSFVEEGDNVHSFMPDSSIPDKLNLLFEFLSNSPDNLLLIHSKYICDILFELLIERSKLQKSNPVTCNCIYKIKHEFDCKYTDNITLEFLEQKYHISKYHICREFIKRFHMPPIKYLNYRKIEAAKEALLNTDKKVVEIGRLVGYDNPNNFIRNFKKYTGLTPLEYRKQFYA
jgi:AraC-like DNA-binding protein